MTRFSILHWLHMLLLLPLLLLRPMLTKEYTEFLQYDIDASLAYRHINISEYYLKLLFVLRNKEFRTIYFHRLKCSGKFPRFIVFSASLIYRPRETLFIYTRNIKGGLVIQHGLCTIIAAEIVGKNCWVNQGVTIGFINDHDSPRLGDNVVVGAGAMVLGNISIGDNVIIGANAVVTKNVPSGCTVAGVPAHIIKRNGQRVSEKL